MPRVPIEQPSPEQRLRELYEFVGLRPPSQRVAVQRSPTGVGIGPSSTGRESNPVPRPRPASSTMRSERPARPTKETQ